MTLPPLSSNQEQLLSEWFRRVRENQFIHYECATWYSRWNLFIGIPSIVLSAIAATAVFASLQANTTGVQAIVVGTISVISAILTSLQTFLGFSELAAQHRTIAASYGSVRRTLEYIKTFPSVDEPSKRFNEIRERMDDLAKEAPAIPSLLKRRMANKLKEKNKNLSSLFATK